jgi:RHS repeat-associated protein
LPSNGQRVATRVDGTLYYIHQDHLGSTVAVSDADSLEVQAVVPYVTKYYYANGQRVAMWQGDVVYYIHADHLGSTSVLSDESGQQAGERVAYLPYGGVRLGDASTLPTDYGFTGQRLEAGLGLMHYGARFYSPRLGRFVSADTIVPEPGEPQALNRYAYVLNNPLRYVDPSGHWIFEESPDDYWFIGGGGQYGAMRRQDQFAPHDPTTGEIVAVATSPFWGAALASGSETLATGLWEAGAIAYETVTWWAVEKLINGGLLGGEAKAAADYACADGDCTNEVTAAEEKVRVVYRGGSRTPANLTPRPGIDTTGLSTFDSLEAATKPGGKAQVIDVSKLQPPLRAIQDLSPPGHVSITPSDAALIEEWAATRGTDAIHPLTQNVINAIIDVVRRPK